MNIETLQQAMQFLAALKSFIVVHWKGCLAVYAAACIVSGMPTPNNNGGVTGTWYYKWAYSSLHTAAANPGRVLAFLAPIVAPFLPAPMQVLLKPFLAPLQSGGPNPQQQSSSAQAAGQ